LLFFAKTNNLILIQRESENATEKNKIYLYPNRRELWWHQNALKWLRLSSWLLVTVN